MSKQTYTRAQLRRMKPKEYRDAIQVYMKETGKVPPPRNCGMCGQPTPKECVCSWG